MISTGPCLTRRTLLATGAAALAAVPAPASAGDGASPWAQATRSGFRLVAGEAAGGRISAGLEIRMAPGFKTYWRSPGDSGIPPRFDWSGSENLAAVEVAWPLPARFSDGAGHSIGYAADVILPLTITAQDPSRPVKLRLSLDYAVCDRICIPAQGSVTLTVPPQMTSPQEARIARFRASVPERRMPGNQGPGPRLADVSWMPQAGPSGSPAIAMNCRSDGPIEVFVEGPEMWAFGLPVTTQAADGRRIITVTVEDRPKTATGPQRLNIILAADGKALEWAVDLDIPPPQP